MQYVDLNQVVMVPDSRCQLLHQALRGNREHDGPESRGAGTKVKWPADMDLESRTAP